MDGGRNGEAQGGGSQLEGRFTSFLRPRADEAALWTLVGAVGQFVLAGWCLAFASFSLMVGLSQLLAKSSLPSWVNGVLAALFIGVGLLLLYGGLRLLAQSLRCFWVAWRKAWFVFAYSRHPDPMRAIQAAAGDPVLEPYLRYLLKRGRLRVDDGPTAEL